MFKTIFSELQLLLSNHSCQYSLYNKLPLIITSSFECPNEVSVDLYKDGNRFSSPRVEHRSRISYIISQSSDSICFTYCNQDRPNQRDLNHMMQIVSTLRGVNTFIDEVKISSLKTSVLDEQFSFLILDKCKKIMYTNCRFARRIEFKAEELVGIYFDQFIDDEDHFRFITAFNDAFAGKRSELMLRMADRTKIAHNVYFEIHPYYHFKCVDGVIIVAREVGMFQKLGVILEDSGLSPTELKIAKLVQSEKSVKEIAQQEFIAIDTVKWHCKQIRKKLGITNSGKTLRAFLKNIN